jgi:hypothetical protein
VPLIFPARLSANQKALAQKYLARLPVSLRQTLLDELMGRIQAESYGARPLYDEMRFLHALCRSAKRREFQPNLGIKVTEARTRSRILNEQARTPPPPPQSATDDAAATAVARAHLDRMRQQLGLPSTK